MKNYLTLLFILTALTFDGCKKGENGADGAKGERGEQGFKGVDGSTIHSGTGAPASSLGNVGDFYLDKTTAEFYGPKTTTSWPTPISLKGSTGATGATGAVGATGATGATGTAGSKILSGTTAPALGIGAEGDFYFDTANLAFYGPKTATSWGSAISLVANNGVTTLLYNNQSFDNVVLTYSYNSTDQNNNPVTNYSFDASKTINISHQAYTNAYNTGLVIVKFKLTNDNNSSWSTRLFFEESTNSYNAGSIGDDDDNYAKTDKVVINGWAGTNSTDPNGNLIKNLKFDVKVVCIPAGTVLQMSAKNIDVKDVKAVARYLKL